MVAVLAKAIQEIKQRGCWITNKMRIGYEPQGHSRAGACMEGHGKYGQALESLGLSRFTAAKVMNAVIKLSSNVSTSAHLLQQKS